MERLRAHPEPVPRRPFLLPPSLDMGSLKLDDLELDLDREVALLRAGRAATHPPRDPVRRE